MRTLVTRDLSVSARIDRRGSVTLQLLVFGATQKITGFLVLGSTALASSAAGALLARRPGWLVWQRWIAGLVMIGLGLRLLLAGETLAFTRR